jgi:hypothetical protein
MKINPTLRRATVRCGAVAALVTMVFGVQGAMTAAPSAPSSVVTVDPTRILDTRIPIGVPAAAPVGPDSSITISVAGVGGVPANATGVIVTLTATDATTKTFITATPTGTPRSATSVLNPGVGSAIANTVTMSLGTDGKIDLYNLTGTVHLVADVTGYMVDDTGPSVMTESIEMSAYSGMGVGIGAADDNGCVDLAETGALYLDVPLPHGAAVTQVDFRWFDNDLANMSMFITEVDNTAPFSNVTLGNLTNNTAQSTGSVGFGGSTVMVGGGDKVSSTVRYHIVATTLGQSAGGTFHRFCGATVTYQRLVA